MYLTKRQRETLRWIRDFLRRKGYSPTLEEIARGLGLSSLATVHKHLVNLEQKGFLRRGWNRGRSIELLPARGGASGIVEVPLLGWIAAGEPIETFPVEETLSIPEELRGKGRTYVLRVRGESMIEEGIRDGDYVIVEERQTARNGETVVVLVEREEVTLKKYFVKGKRVVLKPANPSLKPIVLEKGDFRIQGVVIGLLRKY